MSCHRTSCIDSYQIQMPNKMQKYPVPQEKTGITVPVLESKKFLMIRLVVLLLNIRKQVIML